MIGIYVVSFPVPSETFIVTKVLKMLEADMDVHIFTSQPSPYWEKFEVLKNRADVKKRIHTAPPGRPFWKIFTLGIWQILGKIISHPISFGHFLLHNWRTCKENRLGFWKGVYYRVAFVGYTLDILHIDFDMQAVGVADLKSYLGCKILMSSRGTLQVTDSPYKVANFYTHLFRYADGYHFISEYLKKNSYRLGLGNQIPSWLIQPAVDLDLFRRHVAQRTDLTKASVRLISVGRLAWAKGYEFALDAVARIRDAGIRVEYRIFGEGPYREPIVFAARQLGLLQNETLRFMGTVPRERMPEFYSESDVMLHAALEEGFCNAVIEAQAMGLPVVTSDAGGLPENVDNGVTGFVVPRRNPQALAEKVIILARDPDLRTRMGKAGYERARKYFNLDDQAKKFVRLYEELASK